MAELPQIDGYADPVRIARGGFAVVYRARQDRFDRVVALKVLDADELDERSIRRFERECRVMGSLSWHPNVVAVLDSGVADDHPWLAMEFLDAGSLADRLERGGALPWAEVVDVGIQVAGALGAAHASGVLHRDLKPENLLVGPFGETKLADFGIAAVEGGTRTTTGHASFTVAHVAPEILEGHPPDERSDVYGLGSTLHTLAAGTPPFIGDRDESIATLITRVLQTPAPRLAGVPAALADLVERSLAKDPADRPQSAEELGRALQAVQADEGLAVTDLRLAATGAAAATGAGAAPTVPRGITPTVARPAPGQPEASTVAHADVTPPPAPGEVAEPRPGRRPRVLLALGAVALLVVVGVVVVLTRSDGGGGGGGTPHVAATIHVGRSPRGVTITDEAVWVTTYRDDTVARIDRETNEVTPTGLDDHGPQGISSTPGDVWVGNYSDSTLTRVDPVTGEAVGSIELSGSPQDVSATGDAVWVALLDDAVQRVDPASEEFDDPIPIATGPQSVSATEDAVWATSVVADVVTHLDARDGSVTATIPAAGPWGVSATDEAVWVTNSGDGTVSRIDPATDEVTDTIDVGPDPLGVVATDDAVWVALAGRNEVLRIDPDTLEITTTIRVGAGPQGIAATDDSVWVANEGDGTVTRIDLS